MSARLILAGIFVFFGSNLIFGFMGMPHPAGLAAEFRNAMAQSGYLQTVGALQVVGGVLLLMDATTAVGLVILGPIIVNIALYHLHFHVAGLPLVGLCVADELLLLWLYRSSFNGIFQRPNLSYSTKHTKTL